MGSLTKVEELVAEEGWSKEAIIYVNGFRRVLPDGLAHLTLLEYLRDMRLTGTKLGCGEGGCGACTVMISYYDEHMRKSVHYAINACLAPLYSVEGMHIITVEGIGNCQRGLHPIQESMARAHGSQCGFCTPGFVMSIYALLRSCKMPPSEEQIEESLAGNLCRCTGYRPIIDAFRVFAKHDDSLYTNSSSRKCSNGETICPSSGKPCSCGKDIVNNGESSIEVCHKQRIPFSYNEIDGSSYSEKELIFPPELVLRKKMPLSMCGFGGFKWYRPLRLQHVLDLKSCYPEAKFVVGNTEVGIETKFKNAQYQVLISVTHVPELNVLSVKENGLEIGASLRLAQLQQILESVIAERDTHETSSCRAILEQLKWFAGKQIRNVASIAGNICTASPISDLNPLWMASGAKFQIIDCKGNIRTDLAKDFFLGYRKVNLAHNEILLSIFLPWTRPYEFVKEFKQAHRREDDIALVNAGMRAFLKEDNGNWIVSDVCIVYGGVAPVSLIASKTERFLVGKKWNKKLMQDTLQILKEDVPLAEDAPGGMVEFRKSLTLSFFFKFFSWVTHKMNEKGSFVEGLHKTDLSAIQPYSRQSSVGSQCYEMTRHGTTVGLPIVHLSSKLQVTGGAEYTDDVAVPPHCLHAALVLSKKAHARILSIDDSLSKTSPGFEGLFLSRDIPGSNKIGAAVHDEELFASEIVTCVGQVIGVVVADTHENAKIAANKVLIEYEELPAILSIREAVNSCTFLSNTEKCLVKGDVEWCFQSGACDKITEGNVQVAGQEHFYLEPNSSLVWTVDDGNEVHMISSTQSPQKHQDCVAGVLDLPMSKVVCRTKRIGGGFGGKETRSAFIAASASVPSYLLKRPVKITLDRDIDMMITGQRHSFLGKYKIGYTNAGKLLALDLQLYNNAGNSLDLSLAVLERAMFHSDNVYAIPHIRVRGQVCYTNFPSNTAFRGFGGPQGMLIAENWIQRVAVELKKSPEEIRELNFQSEGYVLHYGQLLENCTLRQVWDELKASCDFSKARERVDHYNLQNRWRKRGIAMIPTKFGISFTTKFMNQAGALVQVYCDGHVLVTHGGVEMGQGLHTKVAQIAASCFNISISSVFISETSTDKIPNASPTAASASSDMYGAAVLDACEQIKARMQPIANRHKHSSFAEIEGAFVQGLGWIALEELKWGDADHKWIRPGNLYTCGPGSYKIPSVNDIPLNFKVALLKGVPNPKAIHSSKAVGEPPFFLASTVLFAIKDAIIAARAEEGYHDWFPLDNPATPERIRMACIDDFTRRFASDNYHPKLSI
ncbi:xanthine dehydrogenase isoform X2 [Elaeis guineensis]|uniref:xanthine dehydrogenase isoform X2 n=1 Tax=Elaeis guineensis var. tenera TaxID=51953 RepID=UPI00057ADCF6